MQCGLSWKFSFTLVSASAVQLASSGIMLQRNARLRREYLYRKSLESKERAVFDKKQKVKKALAGARLLAVCSLKLELLGLRRGQGHPD
jgi:hypothetical protein